MELYCQGWNRQYPSLGRFGVEQENRSGNRLPQFCRYCNPGMNNTVLGH